MVDEVRAITHGFELQFYSLIMGLVMDEHEAPLTKGLWVDMGVIMGHLICFDHLESSMTTLISLFKHK